MKAAATTTAMPDLSEWLSQSEVSAQSALFSEGPTGAILDGVATLVLVLNLQRQTVFANRGTLEILDKSLDDILGLRPGDLFGCAHAAETAGGCGTTASCNWCGARESILMGLGGNRASRECRILGLRDGLIDCYDLMVSSTPMDVAGGRYVVITLHDISDAKRRQALERTFFHDILNTAGGVKGMTELLHQQAEGAMKDDLAVFRESMDRLVEEIRAQRLLMAAENGDLQLNIRPMDARELLDSLLRFHKRSPEAGGRHVRLAELPSDVEFESDEVLVRRVLGNMVKNALEAVGRHGTVTIGCETGPGGPVFSVNNPGVMDRETVNQIFQRSFSTKGRGRGLGTYGMKLFAERYLGGRVWFESNRERGTTFFLALPFSPNADGS